MYSGVRLAVLQCYTGQSITISNIYLATDQANEKVGDLLPDQIRAQT